MKIIDVASVIAAFAIAVAIITIPDRYDAILALFVIACGVAFVMVAMRLREREHLCAKRQGRSGLLEGVRIFLETHDHGASD